MSAVHEVKDDVLKSLLLEAAQIVFDNIQKCLIPDDHIFGPGGVIAAVAELDGRHDDGFSVLFCSFPANLRRNSFHSVSISFSFLS